MLIFLFFSFDFFACLRGGEGGFEGEGFGREGLLWDVTIDLDFWFFFFLFF